MAADHRPEHSTSPAEPSPGIASPCGVVWGQVYGLEHRLTAHKAETFLPQVRHLGVGSVRLFLYWGQIEPEPGRYNWDAVDAFLAQLEPADEAWVTLVGSSPWATRRPSDLLPASPARDPDAYYRFVRALVARCGGRVCHWQADNEVIFLRGYVAGIGEG